MPIFWVEIIDTNRNNKFITVEAYHEGQVNHGMHNRGYKVISITEWKDLIHPKENSRFIFAVVSSILMMIYCFILVIFSFGMFLFILFGTFFTVWFSAKIIKAILVGNAVRVSKNNFPEIYNLLEQIKNSLEYEKSIEVYIVEQGSLNAILYKLFQTQFIMLNSELVEEMLEGDAQKEMIFILSRFIGALKAKHLRLELLRGIINNIEKLKVFNLFLLPYVRATQLTGDQIGLALCKDLGSAISAMNKFFVGNKLANRIGIKGMILQSINSHSGFFNFISTLWSTHPHRTSRYLNLLIFSKAKFPNLFEKYLSTFDEKVASDLKDLIPNKMLK